MSEKERGSPTARSRQQEEEHMLHVLWLALVASIAVFGALVSNPSAEAQQGRTQPAAVDPSAPLTGQALERRIRGRALVMQPYGNRINLFANGRFNTWGNYSRRVTGGGHWRMCGPSSVCADGPGGPTTNFITLDPDGRGGTLHGVNGGRFTIEAIAPGRR